MFGAIFSHLSAKINNNYLTQGIFCCMHGSFAKRRGKCWFCNACGHFSTAPKSLLVILLLCRERKMKENPIVNKILEKTFE
jgi:hypothetical protein